VVIEVVLVEWALEVEVKAEINLEVNVGAFLGVEVYADAKEVVATSFDDPFSLLSQPAKVSEVVHLPNVGITAQADYSMLFHIRLHRFNPKILLFGSLIVLHVCNV
jgi:hypothetical protein